MRLFVSAIWLFGGMGLRISGSTLCVTVEIGEAFAIFSIPFLLFFVAF